MFDRLVRDRKFTEIVSGHLRLDLNGIENLPVIYPNNRPNHLWDDDHIAKVSLNNRRFLIWRCLFLGFSELFDKAHWFALQTALEPSTSTSMDELYKFLILHVKKLFKLNAAVGVGTERPLLLHLRRLGGVSDDFIISLT